MAPSFRSAKNSFFSITSATGGTVNLSSGLDDASLERVVNALDVTTFGDSDKNYIAGLRDATLSLSGHFASTYELFLSAMLGASTNPNWIYGPESTANNRRKVSGAAVLTNYTVGGSVDDKVSMSLTVQCSGAITASTF